MGKAKTMQPISPRTRVTVYMESDSYSCALIDAFPELDDLAEAVRRLRVGCGHAVFGGGAQPACEIYVD